MATRKGSSCNLSAFPKTVRVASWHPAPHVLPYASGGVTFVLCVFFFLGSVADCATALQYFEPLALPAARVSGSFSSVVQPLVVFWVYIGFA